MSRKGSQSVLINGQINSSKGNREGIGWAPDYEKRTEDTPEARSRFALKLMKVEL